MKNKIIVFIILILIIGGGIYLLSLKPKPKPAALDDFAKCLAEKQITMYGAASCSHCQNEKSAFGDSFQYVPYVECPEEPQKCLEKKIEGYPTWILPDGERLVGEQGLEKLSAKSGCELPE